MENIFEIASNISTPLALAGLIGAAFFMLARQILARDLFRKLPSSHTFDLLKHVIDRFFTLSLVAMVLGSIGFVSSTYLKDTDLYSHNSTETIQLENSELISCKESLSMSADMEASILSSYSSSIDVRPRVLCELALDEKPNGAEENGLYARSLVAEGRLEEAIARFQRAADIGDDHSNLVLGRYFLLWRESDRDKGILYLNRAADHGSVEALILLGLTYELGTLYIPDYTKAAEYYSNAVKSGSTEAHYRLGQLYNFGLGVSQDISKARALYRVAAGSGHKTAVEALEYLAER